MSNSADDPLEHLRQEREREVPLGDATDLESVIREINHRLYTLVEAIWWRRSIACHP